MPTFNRLRPNAADPLFGDAPPPSAAPLPPSKLLSEYAPPSYDNEKELLKHRFLCRGGGALLVGSTGAGKSSFIMQCAMLWALGKPAFGIEPARPLKILIIQAENDEDDLFEEMDGVREGLGLTAEEWARASNSVRVRHENSHSGPDFFEKVIRPLLAEWRPDLLSIDPALSYLGGETNSQAHVGAFLRNKLNPLITDFDCGVIVNHHTNKPPSGEDKTGWTDSQMAYAGAGSAEWANWARAVLVLRSTKVYGQFDLIAAKRGARLRWRDEEGETLTFQRQIRHSRLEGQICWFEMTAGEVAEAARSATVNRSLSDEEDVFAMLPEVGSVEKKALLATAGGQGISKLRAEAAITRLVQEGRAHIWEVERRAVRNAIHLSRHPQQG